MARPQDPNAKIELLQAAEAVFVEHGLEKARVEDITARAGRSKGSFYLHFESKEDAFRQIVETMMARMATCLDEPPPDAESEAGAEGAEPIDVAALLATWVDKDVEVFEFLWQNRGICRLLMGGGGSADFAYLIDGFAERCHANIKAWLQWGIARGIYRDDIDVEITCMVFAGAYDRIAREVVREHRKKPDFRAWMLKVQAVLGRGVFTPALCAVVDQSVMNDRPISAYPPRQPSGQGGRGRPSPPRH